MFYDFILNLILYIYRNWYNVNIPTYYITEICFVSL